MQAKIHNIIPQCKTKIINLNGEIVTWTKGNNFDTETKLSNVRKKKIGKREVVRMLNNKCGG